MKTFVALSTDKAVNPTGVMGASKLVAERFLQSLGEGSTTKFVVVRFGNVIGSSGTAVPIFTRQLVRRQPITVTHPDVARRFLTASVAARLSLEAGALAGGSGTFVLDMGEPVKIVEIVKSLAFVMRVPKEDVEIRFDRLRDGEKLAEELFFDDESRHSVGATRARLLAVGGLLPPGRHSGHRGGLDDKPLPVLRLRAEADRPAGLGPDTLDPHSGTASSLRRAEAEPTNIDDDVAIESGRFIEPCARQAHRGSDRRRGAGEFRQTDADFRRGQSVPSGMWIASAGMSR